MLDKSTLYLCVLRIFSFESQSLNTNQTVWTSVCSSVESSVERWHGIPSFLQERDVRKEDALLSWWQQAGALRDSPSAVSMTLVCVYPRGSPRTDATCGRSACTERSDRPVTSGGALWLSVMRCQRSKVSGGQSIIMHGGLFCDQAHKKLYNWSYV